MSKRTDVHRVSQIRPEEYCCVLFYALASQFEGWPAAGQRRPGWFPGQSRRSEMTKLEQVFQGWWQNEHFRVEKLSKGIWAVYERNGNAYVRCATVRAPNAAAAIGTYFEAV